MNKASAGTAGVLACQRPLALLSVNQQAGMPALPALALRNTSALQSVMIILFQRTGQRRYGIQVKRPPFPDVEMTPAPGYDQLMPHDMLHLVVEAKLGLTRGIFGQLAEGGDAGTFHISTNKQTTRELSRARNRLRTRGKKLLREGREESERSERATYICWYEWRNRSSVDKQRSQARSMVSQATEVKGVAGKQELRSLSARKIDEICECLDELSSHWSRLEVGQRMIVRWPDLAVVDNDPLLPEK